MEKTIKKKIICFVAGHSGGHIIPCLTLAQKMKKKDAYDILFFASHKKLDRQLVTQNATIDHYYHLPIDQKRQWYLLAFLVVGLGWSSLKSLVLLCWYRPQQIISTGSIIAIPVCLAGWLLGIPIVLFELNAKPGKTISFLSYFASKIYVCFAKTKGYFKNKTCEYRSYPIRFAPKTTTTLLSHFYKNRFTLFIQGGSQGSRSLNTTIQNVIQNNTQLIPHIQVIHQTGDSAKKWQQFYDTCHIPSHVFSYENDLSGYYRQAHLIICRSGAGTLFETVYFQKPCITVPLQTITTSHQIENAQAISSEFPNLFQWMQDPNLEKKIAQYLKIAILKAQEKPIEISTTNELDIPQR